MIPPPSPPPCDPVVSRYRQLFQFVDWSVVPDRDPGRAWPGPKPAPPSAFVKALLIKVLERHRSIPQGRQFLVEHPALAVEIGFRPVYDPVDPSRLDGERIVPSARWLRHHQQHLTPALGAQLLASTIQAAHALEPTLGTVVAIDVTHHYAWVRENNPNQTLTAHFRAARPPRGDPDCRLGAKRRQPTPRQTVTAAFWGYQSGLAASPSPLGDLVLAVAVRPVLAQEVAFFAPLYAQTCATLGHPPQGVTADAAFDAWHVYDPLARTGGLAAIAPNPRGGAPPRTPDGHPRCAAGLGMTPTGQGRHEDGYRIQRYRCPLRGEPAATCPHPRFAQGGCTKRINIEPGGRHRATLDRTSPAYQHLYRQRPCAERLFSRLKALGLEQPCARRLSTVTTILTLGYLALNLLTLAKATAAGGPLAMP